MKLKNILENIVNIFILGGFIIGMPIGVGLCIKKEKVNYEITKRNLEDKFDTTITNYTLSSSYDGTKYKWDTILKINNSEYIIKNDSLIPYFRDGAKERMFLPNTKNPMEFITAPGTKVPYIF